MDDNNESSECSAGKEETTIKEDGKEVVNKDVIIPEIIVDRPSGGCSDLTSKEKSKDVKSSNEGEAIDEENLHYENDICIYTEPESKCQFVWDEGKQEWVSRNNSSSFTDKDYEYDGSTYTYVDKETSIKYSWDVNKNEWNPIENVAADVQERKEKDSDTKSSDNEEKIDIVKQDMSKGQYNYENDTHVYTDPSDGSKYVWDKEKKAWFPKIDDDFLAMYQMSYGFTDPKENEPENKEINVQPVSEAETLKRKVPQEPAWFNVGEESTKVYVSGLPLDITETEFMDIMQKCGLVMRDIDSGKMKVKIYLDPTTSLPKGDALCTYIKKESVDLALNLLDGSDVRGHRITVERAKFTMKGDAYDPSLKPKKKRKKDKEKMKKIQEKLFDWRPDKMRGERSKHEKIVIVKNLFDPIMFNKDVKLILEYQQDLREECLKCGSVKKVTVFDRHPEGVAQVNFKEVEAADACVQLLNGRWFGKRKITAETWDGKTKYKITETDEQIKARLEKWEKFLETGQMAKEEGKAETIESINEPEVKSSEESVEIKEKTENEKISITENLESETNEINMDSDETRSSVGSNYDTDDEMKTSV